MKWRGCKDGNWEVLSIILGWISIIFGKNDGEKTVLSWVASLGMLTVMAVKEDKPMGVTLLLTLML